MAGLFKQGDQVNVNGVNAEIISWPPSNTGAFRYRTKGRGGVSTEQTAFVKNSVVGLTDKPLSEGGEGQPTQQVLGVDQVKMVQAAPPPPPPQPIDPAILREIEREDAEAAEKKRAADEAALAAMRASIKAELMAELMALGVIPAAKLSEDEPEPEAVNREVHEGEVVATEPELVIEHEEEIEAEEAPAAPAQPWGRGRAARMHREVAKE